MADQIDAHTQVSAESADGRVLTGVGVSAESLETTIEQHDDKQPAKGVADKLVDAVIADRAPATQEPPQLAKGRARYSQLVDAQKAADARAAAAEKERDDLKARLSQPPQPQTGQPAQTQPAAPAKPEPTRAKPSEDEIGTKYPTYADFVEDLSDWKTEQRMAAFDVNAQIRQTLEAERNQQAVNAQVEQTRVKGRAAYKDFDELLKSGPGTFVDMPMPAVHAILTHPQSEHLQHAIMKDAAVAQNLAGLAFTNPYAFGVALEKLVPAQTAPIRSMSPPPPPMVPVGSGSRTATPSSAEFAQKGDYAAYKAARAAERKGRG